MNRLVLRLLVPALLLTCVWKTGNQFLARRVYWNAGNAADLQRALGYDDAEPAYRHGLGRELRDVPWDLDLEQARLSLEAGSILNPWNRLLKLDLARVYEIERRAVDAERVYREATRLRPRAGDPYWQLGNFYLRNGRKQEALEEFGRAMVHDPWFVEVAVPLMLQAGYTADEIGSALPHSAPAARLFLRTLTGDEGGVEHPIPNALETDLWERMVGADPLPDVSWYDFYLDYLVDGGETQRARRLWTELWAARNRADEAYATGQESVWNSDFDHPPCGSGLGWRVLASEHYDSRHLAGKLEIEFLGTENLHFRQLRQISVLEPGERYRLEARVDVDGITTDEGVYFEILDPRDGRVLAETAMLEEGRGQTVGRDFDAPVGDGAVEVRLRRRPSRRLDNRLSGIVRIDRVSLRRVESL